MRTQLSKPARGYARYTDEYKEQALQLWPASGRSAAKVGAELGIRPPLLLEQRGVLRKSLGTSLGSSRSHRLRPSRSDQLREYEARS